MASDDPKFFTTRDERKVLDWVINDFPFPLALNYSRLQDELDKQSPIAAAWKLRDTFECLIEFTACVAIADFLQANPDPEDVSSIVALLFKYNGLSTGDWVSLLVGQSDEKNKGPLRQLEAFVRSDSLDKSGRLFPELFNLFFKLRSQRGTSPSDLTKWLNAGSPDPNKYGFVQWRNRVFGHGTFKSDYGFYAEETNRWVPILHEFLEALRPVFADWSLVSVASDGSRSTWQGAQNVPYVESHVHEPKGEPRPMQFVHSSSSRSLSFGLLMSLQQCTYCKQPTAFFFNRNQYERKPNRHTTYFLEYSGGHEESQQNLSETKELATKLPPHFDWKRVAYDSLEVQANLALLFRDFDKELVRPDYLADTFWSIVEGQGKGYVHLIGDSGMGKTFFVRALEAEGKDRDIPVLAYHILAGALSDYRTFISELSDRAKEKLRFRTQEAQTRVAALTDLQEQFKEYLGQLMSANNLNRLVVAIDALDELPEPEASGAAITSLLPAPDQLPAGCFVLLTSRESLQSRVRQDLDQLAQRDAKTKATGQPEHFTKIRIRPADAENQRLLLGYLQQHLPERFRDRASIETVLRRSGSVFLYAFHFCHALESGAFADLQTLPEGKDFYPAYLASLREATDRLYDTVYLKALLLIAAAQTPVTLDQLVSWGVRKQDLPYDLPIALIGIKDFLRLHRVRRWHDSLSEDEGEHRYDIAHEGFVRYLREDGPMAARLREAHANIARRALATHQGKWKELNAEDDAQLYNLRFVLIHLRAAGLTADEAVLGRDEEYASQCWDVAEAAQAKAKYIIAADLCDNAVSAYRYLIGQGRSELQNDLARVLLNKGSTLSNLGKLEESIGYHDEAIGIYQQLVTAGRSELANDLATMLASKGGTLSNLRKLAGAISVYDEAIRIRRQLVNGGRSEVANDLAGVLAAKGVAVSELGQHEAAIGIFDESIAILRQSINAGPSRLADELELALTLVNKGAAFIHLHRQEDAIGIFDEATGIYRRLINEGRTELSNDLARVLMNKGNALADMGRQEEAISLYDEVIVIRRQLSEAGRGELANSLALALMNKALAITELGKPEEAIGFLDEATQIYRRLINQGRPELASDLAKALINRGLAVASTGKLEEAIGDLDEAIVIYRQLVKTGRSELTIYLATALMNKGNAVADLGKAGDAISAYDEAIEIYRPLIQAGRKELSNDLAKVLMNKGMTLVQLRDWQNALIHYDEGIELQVSCVNAGMTYLLPQLLQSMRLRRHLGLIFEEWEIVAQDVLEVCQRITPFLQAGELPAPIAQEVRAMRNQIDSLAVDGQQQIYSRLGEWAAILREL